MKQIAHSIEQLIHTFITKPSVLKVVQRNGTVFLQPDVQDCRLVIGKNGRNIEALESIANLMAQPDKVKLEVSEPGSFTGQLQERPLVSNSDRGEDDDIPFINAVKRTLEACGYGHDVMVGFPDEYTTSIIARVDRPMELEEKKSFSIIFGAMGRIHGRNIRIHINDDNTN